MRSKRLIPIVAAAGLLGAGLFAVIGAGPDSEQPEAISDTQCLRKMALDLTNTGPTTQQVADLEAGKTLGELADELMATSEFETVVFDWYREQYPPTEITPLTVDIEEPARIATHVVVQNRDYRELMTGDYTIDANGDVATVSDRPPAGVISTAQYMSAYTGSFRRNWSGHFLKQFSGIVLEPVTLPPDTDPDDLSPDSLETNPSCSSCHFSEIHGVDPLARFAQCYTVDGSYESGCATEGSFLTETASGLQGLGQIMAGTNEFKHHAINFFYKKLFSRNLAREEATFYARLATDFTTNDYKPKDLIKTLVTSAEYCSR